MGLGAQHPQRLSAVTGPFGQHGTLRFAGYGVSQLDHALYSDDIRPVLYTEDSLGIDRFAVYEVPLPEEFRSTPGNRHIRVALAFDPPVRNTRKEYLGVTMGFHLVRGVSEQEVFDRFRKWETEDREEFGDPPRFARASSICDMLPRATLRERGTLQVATFTAKRPITQWGDRYFLVVRCEGKWAASKIQHQRFAAAVQLWHEANVEIYEHLAVEVIA